MGAFAMYVAAAAVILAHLSARAYAYPTCAGVLAQQEWQQPNSSSLPAAATTAHLRRPSVLYLNMHQGTAMDLAYVCNHLGVPFKWINPHLPYGVTKEIANEDHKRYSEYQCGTFDFIIVGDTVSRARALLEHGCSSSQIILQVTQRFDIRMDGALKQEWIQLLKHAAATMGNVRMVVNNPYEQWYIEHVRNASFFKPILIRPSGHWPEELLPPVRTPGNLSVNAVRWQPYTPYLNTMLKDNLHALGIPFVELGQHYGGARGLAGYRCVLQWPYQASVMAMYENLAAGAVLMVPSKRFFQEVAPSTLHKPHHGTGYFLDDLKVLQTKPGGWEAMEWFNAYFQDAFIYYDSWEHLKELLRSDDTLLEHRQKVKRFMVGHTARVLREWDSLLWCSQSEANV